VGVPATNARHGLHWIGPVPASDCPDLTALPASARAVVDKDRFGGLTGYATRASSTAPAPQDGIADVGERVEQDSPAP
jgi:hypothetical protein